MEKLYSIVSEPDNVKRVLSHSCEAMLQGCFELRDEGYTLRAGEVFASLAGYSAFFDAPGGATATDPAEIKEPEVDEASATPAPEFEVITGTVNMSIDGTDRISITPPKVVDVELIKSFGKDRTALDEYAETFDVKLNRSKSFKNMLIDFEEALKV